MIVLSMSVCPVGLRGDITKWLVEIDTGVYIGSLSARVRDELWDRICKNIGNGRAIMAYNAQNPQGYSFKTYNTIWKPVDFDGLTFMLHPVTQKLNEKSKNNGKKTKNAPCKEKQSIKGKSQWVDLEEYTVIDLETSGLDCTNDSIIELAALKVKGGEVVTSFNELLKLDGELLPEIIELTGITNEMLKNGNDSNEAIKRFISFIGNSTLISHNATFDIGFINALCKNNNFQPVNNSVYDTLKLSRKYIRDIDNYRLGTIAKYFSIDLTGAHRAKVDASITLKIFEKLKEKVRGRV